MARTIAETKLDGWSRMSANAELFDGKYTAADLRVMIADGQIAPTSGAYKSAMAFMELRAVEEAHAAEARAKEAHQSAIQAQRLAVRIAVVALLVSLGAMGLSVVAISESHIHAPAKL